MKKISKYSSQDKEASISMEFYENNSYDIEGDYIEQKNKPPTFFEYQGFKKETPNPKASEKTKVYFVRIPVVTSKIKIDQVNSQFLMKYYFYFKSYKTQEFWLKRGTKIYLNK